MTRILADVLLTLVLLMLLMFGIVFAHVLLDIAVGFIAGFRDIGMDKATKIFSVGMVATLGYFIYREVSK